MAVKLARGNSSLALKANCQSKHQDGAQEMAELLFKAQGMAVQRFKATSLAAVLTFVHLMTHFC